MNSFTIETPANNKKGWRKVPDCNFSSRISAENYGLKYHTDKYGSRMFRTVEIEGEE